MSKKIKKIEVLEEEEVIINEDVEVDAMLTTLPSKSAKIRYLTSLGWERSRIANKLGVIYQHVRNVQVTLLKKDM